jgi:hypothetical protein
LGGFLCVGSLTRYFQDDRTMNRSLTILASALLAAASRDALAGNALRDPLVPERMMVRVADDAALASLVSAARATFDGVEVIDAIAGRPIHMLSYRLRRGQTDETASAFCAAQVALGAAVWAELNYLGQSGEGRTDSFWLSQFDLDPGIFESQYGGGVIGLPSSRGRSLGQGTLIAVLDTGIDEQHPAFGGRVQSGGASFVAGAGTSDAPNGLDDDGDGLVDEQVGHGTFVAGLVHLVAPEAWILPVTVLNSDGVGDLWTIGKGIAFAIDRGADVINLSLGSTYSSALLEDVVHEADLKGIVVAAAMGNMARTDPEEYPAGLTTVLAVCATDPVDGVATFSNFGPKADLCAPGTTLVAGGAVVTSQAVVGPVPGGRWAAWQGTSFATAFASGVAALVRAQHPEWPDATTPLAAIDDAIIESITGASMPIDSINPGYEKLIGSGRLDASAATALAPAAPRFADLNLDGRVSGGDLGILLGDFGLVPPLGSRSDLNRDGRVSGADLGLLLGRWD